MTSIANENTNTLRFDDLKSYCHVLASYCDDLEAHCDGFKLRFDDLKSPVDPVKSIDESILLSIYLAIGHIKSNFRSVD